MTHIPRLSDIMDTYQGLFVKIDNYNTIPNSTYKIIYKLFFSSESINNS